MHSHGSGICGKIVKFLFDDYTMLTKSKFAFSEREGKNQEDPLGSEMDLLTQNLPNPKWHSCILALMFSEVSTYFR